MPVFGDGPRDAKIAIVGEAPGREEEAKGRPFIGSSGQLLNGMLSIVGVARNECYVTNVVKTRPPNNNFKNFYDDKQGRIPSLRLQKDIDFLHKELDSINPNIIIAMGNEPLRALTGRQGIAKWRGSLLKSGKGHKCLATYHPAFVLRMYHFRAIVELDLKKAKRHSTTPGMSLPPHTLDINPSFEQVMTRLDWIHSKKPLITFDIETVGRHVRCLGFAWHRHRAICVPFTSSLHGVTPGGTVVLMTRRESNQQAHWTEKQEELIVRECRRILEDINIPKVAQNAPFDMTILAEEFNIHTQGLAGDTMLAQHTCYAELGKPPSSDPTRPSTSGSKSLDFLCSVYTDVPRYSDYDASDDLQTWRYNCMDCCVTYEVWQHLIPELTELGVKEFYDNHVMPFMFTAARMQNIGVHVDIKLRDEYITKCEEKMESIQEDIKSLVNHELNPNSPKQMQMFLYEELKLTKRHHPITKKVTTDKEAIAWLRKHHPEHTEILDKIIQFRQVADLKSDNLSVRLSEGDRIQTTFNPAGTVNGRLASSKTIWGEGTNMQNFPKGTDPSRVDFGIRRIIIPPPGYTFIKADLSQAEVRVVAWEANILTLIERFVNDPSFDIHRWNATNIFGGVEADITTSQRYVAKAGVHGGNYGLGADKASKIYDVPYQEAKRAIDSYRSALPEVEQWWSDIQRELNQSRTLFSILGRRRTFFGRIDQELYRSAYSFKPQATVADVVNRALIFMFDVLSDQLAWPVLQVHDEICTVAPLDKAEEVMHQMVNLMEYPIIFPEIEHPLIIPVDIGHGPSWGEQEEWEHA